MFLVSLFWRWDVVSLALLHIRSFFIGNLLIYLYSKVELHSIASGGYHSVRSLTVLVFLEIPYDIFCLSVSGFWDNSDQRKPKWYFLYDRKKLWLNILFLLFVRHLQISFFPLIFLIKFLSKTFQQICCSFTVFKIWVV